MVSACMPIHASRYLHAYYLRHIRDIKEKRHLAVKLDALYGCSI